MKNFLQFFYVRIYFLRSLFILTFTSKFFFFYFSLYELFPLEITEKKRSHKIEHGKKHKKNIAFYNFAIDFVNSNIIISHIWIQIRILSRKHWIESLFWAVENVNKNKKEMTKSTNNKSSSPWRQIVICYLVLLRLFCWFFKSENTKFQ